MAHRFRPIPASLLILLAVPALLAAQGQAPRVRPDGLRTIKVVGTAEVLVAPDTAVLVLGVETQGRTANESLASNGQQMASLMGVLKKQGIADEDVQTSDLSLSPVYERPRPGEPEIQPPSEGKIVGYRAGNRLSITLRDTKKVGDLIDLLVGAGANRIDSLSFRVSKKEPLLRDLRMRAIADAREKAGEGAQASNMELGLPLSIDIQDVVPEFRGYAMSSMAGLAPAPQATPIAMGRELLRATAEVVYELKAPQ